MSDKLLHLAGYALLGVLFYRAYRSRWENMPARRLFWLSAASTALYGLSDELHQYFVPYRNADVMDAAADAAGGLIGAALAMALHAVLDRRRSAGP
jgi:VanZ family protein